MERGKFIVFEGIDGAGKSTMFRRALKLLRANNVLYGDYKFPSEDLDIFVDPTTTMREALLFISDQVLFKREFTHIMKNGWQVIADRYTPSVYAYQVTQNPTECSYEKIKTIEQAVFGDFKPDHIFLFDLPADIALMRANERDGTGFDNEEAKKLNAAREMYLRLAREDPNRYIIIDAAQPEKEVWKQVETNLKQIFKLEKD